jgi:predicted RNA-binding protein
MCEFEVSLKEKTVFKDAVYAKADGNKVIVKDVLGTSKVFENCKITEVDVGSERMVLSSTKT